MKEWKTVEHFEGLYEVSNHGEVRSLPHLSVNGSRLKGRELSLIHNANDEYLRVNLRKSGKPSVWLVHRLVAEAFVPKQKGKTEVNHKDGNKHNNAANNLEWVTASENQQHALRTGLRKLNDPSHSKKVGVYNPEGTLCDTYPSVAEAQRKTGLSLCAIYNRCNGRVAKPLHGCVWRYI